MNFIPVFCSDFQRTFLLNHFNNTNVRNIFELRKYLQEKTRKNSTKNSFYFLSKLIFS